MKQLSRHITLIFFMGLLSLSVTTDQNEVHKPQSQMVYICDSDGAYAYHLKKDCQGLKRCKHTVLFVSKEEAFKRGKKKFCGYED